MHSAFLDIKHFDDEQWKDDDLEVAPEIFCGQQTFLTILSKLYAIHKTS